MRVGVTQQLARRFGRRVRRDRLEDRIVLGERRLLVLAVDGRGRAEDELPHAARAREFEQVDRAVDVGLGVERRLRERGPDARARRQMHDHVNRLFAERACERRAVADVRLDESERCAPHVRLDVRALDGRIVEVVEVVHDRHAPSALAKQPLDQMRADKTRAARDKDVSHGRAFSIQRSAISFELRREVRRFYVNGSERVYKAMRRSSVRSGMFIARARPLSLSSPGGATDIYTAAPHGAWRLRRTRRATNISPLTGLFRHALRSLPAKS